MRRHIYSNKKYYLSCLLGLSLLSYSEAQKNKTIDIDPTDEKYLSTQEKPIHESWREGKYPFPGKPRDMWQVGIGGGGFFITGDVKPQFGWGASAFVRKSLGYSTSLRLEYMFGQARGLNYTPSFQGAHPNVAPFTVSNNAGSTPGLYAPDDPFYANYFIPQFHALSLQGMFNLNNIRFHRKNNRWSFNLLAGLGAQLYQTRYNALDANGNAYDFRFVANGLDPEKRADRKGIRDNIKSLLDDESETVAQMDRAQGFIVGKDDKAKTLRPYATAGINIEYMVTPRVSIALEHQSFFSADDFIDGKSRNESGNRTGGMDVPHYTTVRLAFHLGSKEKRVPPLWFVNPMTHPLNDIADLKNKLDDEWFKDDDDDGVVNKLDQEPDTKPGMRVDTKGRTLDSDGDGIPDTEDKEPFSPPGYPTDPSGVAQVPPALTEKDVIRIGDDRYELKGKKPAGGGSLNDWFLPMVHYDLDQYYLRSESYGDLHHIASVMQSYPNMKIVAHGHADNRATNEYNEMLSYNRAMSAIDYLSEHYGIAKDRFIVKYSGKSVNLIKDVRMEKDHFMNRRVEFSVAKDGDKSQERPQGDGGINRRWKY